MERAYDDWKDETWSKDPYVDMLIPTQVDPNHGAPGQAHDDGVCAVLLRRHWSTAASGPTPTGMPSARL